jgi:hypothetical protein
MGTKDKPAPFDCYANALPDEPMFILLARDPHAPRLIEEWAIQRRRDIDMGERPKEDQAMVNEAIECADNMRNWRFQNHGKWRKPKSD